MKLSDVQDQMDEYFNKPIIKEIMKEKEEITHPAFAQIQFSRVNSNGTRFYGSELKQNSYISFDIQGSTLCKELGIERYSTAGNKGILRGRMSSGQFAEMITNMNSEGIPCTLEYVNGSRIEELPELENYKEFSLRKFEDRMVEFSEKLDTIALKSQELVKKKTLSKNDQLELKNSIQGMVQEIKSNIPFFAKEFQQQTDKVVLEAKVEIENALLHKVNTLGLKALNVQNDLNVITKICENERDIKKS